MAENLIPVNILLADRTYRLKINPDDEEVVRKTVKLINEKIIEYKTNFSGNDMQDYVAMVLLWYATEQQKPEAGNTLTSGITHKLQKLENLLDKTLAKK